MKLRSACIWCRKVTLPSMVRKTMTDVSGGTLDCIAAVFADQRQAMIRIVVTVRIEFPSHLYVPCELSPGTNAGLLLECPD